MAEPVLCLLPTCRVPGRQHRDGCDEDGCTCLRARAADGLRLCVLHTARIGGDAVQLAELHDELALRLLGGTGMGERVGGTPDDTRIPNQAASEIRREIHHVLMSWTQLIAEERGVHLPDGSAPARVVKAMTDTPIWRGQGTIEQAIAGPPEVSVEQAAAFVAKHAVWLAATEYTDEVATELGALRRRAWSVCYPRGVRTVPLYLPDGHPIRCLDETCPGIMTARVDAKACDADRKGFEFPAVLECSANEEHDVPSTRWHAFARAVKERAA